MVDMLLTITAIIILISLLITLIRFIIGPHLADRIISMDVLTISSIGLIALLTHIFNRFIYLDVAIVYGILSFIGVLVVARYLERSL